jgi:hypothetical protein
MNEINIPRVKLVIAVTYGEGVIVDDIMYSLEVAFGLVDGKSAEIDFNHTDYYTPEMGPNLKKVLLSFDQQFQAGDLWLAKRTAIDIEEVYKRDHKRRINIDPGYLETSKFVLASTKNFSHRIYLNQGIFGEVTLTYSDNAFQKLPWTYPDYLEPVFLDFLSKTREELKRSLR